MNKNHNGIESQMDKKSFTRKMLYIAVPIMVQALIAASVNLIDTLMVGKLGESAIASLGVANQYFMLYLMAVKGIYAGVGIFISQYWGKKDIFRIKAFTVLNLKLGIMLTIFFVLAGSLMPKYIMAMFTTDGEVIQLGASYLTIVVISYMPYTIAEGFSNTSRNVGRTVFPMIASVAALCVNVVLNYGLIYGKIGMPALGVQGAAVATLIARVTEMAIVLLVVYFNYKDIAVSFKDFIKSSRDVFSQVAAPMSQVVLNDVFWGLGMTIYTMIYGRIGTGALASVQIMTTVQNLFITVIMAISTAACVMIGNQIGEGNYKLVKEQAFYFIRIVAGVTLIIGVFVGAAINPILSFFTIEAGVRQSAELLLYITAAFMPIRGLGILFIIGILRGGGDAKSALRIELFTMWIIGVPACYLGAIILGWPVEKVYLLVMAEEIVKLLLTFTRFRKGEWINDFTQEREMKIVKEVN
ncbi:MAG: MATE family efflux transporter [Proteocatella sp.]